MLNEWIKGKRCALAPIVAVSLVVIVYAVVNLLFIQCKPRIAKCEPFNASHVFPFNTNHPIDPKDNSVNGSGQDKITNRKVIADRYSGRLVWIFLAGTNVILGIASLFATGGLIYKSSSFRGESRFQRTTILVGLSFLFGTLLFLFPGTYAPILRPIVAGTIDRSGQMGIPIVFGTMNLIHSFTFVAAFALMFANCAILLPRETVPEPDKPVEGPTLGEDMVTGEATAGLARLDNISEQMKDLRIVLYVGTFLLIIGVLLVSAVTQWALAFISPDAIDAAKTFNITFASVTGGFYSLIVGAMYLPAACILHRRVQLLAKELPLPPDQLAETLQAKGLTFSFRESVPRVLAILGPLLAGPIGEVFKVFPT